MVHWSTLYLGSNKWQAFLRLGAGVYAKLGTVVLQIILLLQKIVNFVLNLSIHLFFLNHVKLLRALHLHYLRLYRSRIVSFRTRKGIVAAKRQECLHQHIIIQKVEVDFLGRFWKIIKVLNERTCFFLNGFIIGSLCRFVFQIHIIEIGEVDVHFADVLEKLGSIQSWFCLNCY